MLDLVFGGWPRLDVDSPIDYWRWKYGRTDLNKKVVVAVDDDRIVGCLHDPTVLIKVGPDILEGDHGTDAAIHPDYRRRGIYTQLDDYFDDLILSYNHSDNPIVYEKSQRSGGVRFPFDILTLVRVGDIDEYIMKNHVQNKYVFKTGFLVFKLLNALKNRLIDRVTYNKYETSTVDVFDDKADIFWDKIQGKYNYIIARSTSYLNWRYCDPRAGEYIIRTIKNEDMIEGITVLRINKYDPENKQGYIVDLLTVDDKKDIVLSLLDEAIKVFEEEGVNIIHFWAVKGSLYERYVKMKGFIDSRKKNVIWFARPPQEIMEKYFSILENSSADEVHFPLGDMDWI